MSYQDTRRKRRANLFTNDLRSLMYAFGDVPTPYSDSVTVLEDILQEYIINLCHEAHRVARTAGRQKIKVDDFKFALRGDHRKLGRVDELLLLQRQINDARKQFETNEGKSLSKEYVDKGDVDAEDSKVSGTTSNSQSKKVGRPKKYKKKEKE